MKRQSFLIVLTIAFTFWGLVGATSGSQGNLNPANELIMDQYGQGNFDWDDDDFPRQVLVNLMVEDMEKSLHFYKGLLGFNVRMQMPVEGKAEWVMLGYAGKDVMMLQERASLEKEIDVFKGQKAGGTVFLYTSVNSAASLYDQIKEHVDVFRPLEKKGYGMEEFVLVDPDGYYVIIASELKAGK